MSLVNPDGCSGCEDRADIMGAGTWQADALVVGVGVFLILVIAYFQK